MRRFALSIVCLLLLSTFGAEGAPLSVVGEWRYGDYRAEEGGRSALDGRYFSQQYSLLYQKKGKFLGGRGGAYDLALGGEWTSIDSKINDESIDIDTAKILYRGDLLIAPGGLPFRLHLFAHDMHRTQLVTDYMIPRNRVAGQDQIFTPFLVNNLNNGQHILTGATLLVGIRNGSYLGAYRDILSQFPRLLVDYSENYVRDLESRTPEHYRDRNLAFVSLNKKDNWFHYRLRDYRDFENPSQNFTEKTIMLGTVDHTLTRQWINLTNWIRISADGSYTESDELLSGPSLNGVRQPVQRYDLNLFTTARRTNWEGATFTTLNRRRETESLDKNLEVPIMASGEIDRNTAWRFNFIASRSRQEFQILDGQKDRDFVYAATRLETFRQGRFILAPHLAAENRSGDYGEGSTVRAGVEYYSNRAYSPRHDLFGAYTVLSTEGTSRDGGNVDYWEQELTGRIDSRLTSNLRTGIEEILLLGSGDLDHIDTERIVPRGSRGLIASGSDSEQRGGELLRSTTTWFGEYVTASRLANRLEVAYDYLSADDEVQDQIVLSHSLRYDRQTLRVSMNQRVVFGDDLQAFSTASETLGVGGNSVAKPDFTYRNSASLHYSPSRQWETDARFDYDWSGGNGSDTSLARLVQGCQYNLFTVNGLIRKLAEFREEFELERFDNATGPAKTATILTLRSSYFPTSRTLLGATLRYGLFSPEDNDELSAEFTVGVNFQKLVVSLDYAYGTRSAGDLIPERVEHRWEAKVKKIF